MQSMAGLSMRTLRLRSLTICTPCALRGRTVPWTCLPVVVSCLRTLAVSRTSNRAIHGHYLVSIVLRLYRQSPSALRSRCLGVIGQLALADTSGLTSA